MSSLSEDQILNQIISRVYQFLAELRADSSNLSSSSSRGGSGGSSAATGGSATTGYFEDSLADTLGGAGGSHSGGADSGTLGGVVGSSAAAQDTLSRRVVNSSGARDFIPAAPNARLSLPHHEASLQMFTLGASKLAKANGAEVQKQLAKTSAATLDTLYKTVCIAAPSLWPVVLPDPAADIAAPNHPFPFGNDVEDNTSTNKINTGLFLRSDDAFAQVMAPVVGAAATVSVQDIARALETGVASQAARSLLRCAAWDAASDVSALPLAVADATPNETAAAAAQKDAAASSVAAVVATFQALEAALKSTDGTALLVAAIRAEAALRRFVSTPDGKTTTIRSTDELRRAIATFLNNTKGVNIAEVVKAATVATKEAAAAAPPALNWNLHVRAHQPTPVEKEEAPAAPTAAAVAAASTTGTAAASDTASTTSTTSSTTSTAATTPALTREQREAEKKKKKLKKKAPPEKPWRLPLRLLPGFKFQLAIEEGLPHTSANSLAFVVGAATGGKVVQVPKAGAKETLVLEHADGGNSYLFGKGDAIRVKVSVTAPLGVASKLCTTDVAIAVAGFLLTATEVLSQSNPTSCAVAISAGSDKKTKAATAAAAAADSTEASSPLAVAAAAAAPPAGGASPSSADAEDKEKKEEEEKAAADAAVAAAAATARKRDVVPVLRADPLFSFGLLATPLESPAKSQGAEAVADPANASKINMFFMRAQCQASWKPLAAKLVSLVVHCGAGFSDATLTYVAQRWGPDWNEPLQGEVNKGGRDRLNALFDFVLTKVQAQPAASQTAASILSHLRTVLIDQEQLSVADIERELAARSEFASAAGVGLAQLGGIVAQVEQTASVARAAALNLIRWLGKNGRHYLVGPFGGARADAAASLRRALASLLSALQESSERVNDPKNHAADIKPALHALVCTPTLSVDDIVAIQEERAAAQICKKMLAEANPSAPATTHDATQKGGDLGAACRLVQLCPAAQPEMNTNALGVTVGSSSTGISINRTSMGGLCLRSSCAWPIGGDSALQFPDGVRYAEFTFQQTKGNVLRAMIGICDANTKFVDFEASKSEIEGGLVGTTALDSKVEDSKNKMSVPFGYEGDVVGVGVDLHSESVFYTLNGHLMFSNQVKLAADHVYTDDTVGGAANIKYQQEKKPAKSVRKDFHPFLMYEARDRTTVNANFGHSPFVFDVVQHRANTGRGGQLLTHGFDGDLAARCVLFSSGAAATIQSGPWVVPMVQAAGKALGNLLNVQQPGSSGMVSCLRSAMLCSHMILRMADIVNNDSALFSNVAPAIAAEFKSAQATALQGLRMVCKSPQVSESIRAVCWHTIEVLLKKSPGLIEPSSIQRLLLDSLRGAQDQQKEEDAKKKQNVEERKSGDARSPLSTASSTTSSAAAASAAAKIQAENSFLPAWSETDETVAVLNGPRVTVAPRPIDDVDEEQLEQHHAGIPAMAVGSPLPEGADVVSFRVYFHRPPLPSHSGSSSRMASGGCFIGVTSQTFAALSAQQDWKTASPPAVWAMHDEASFQLPHADIATVMTDNITFMAGSTVTVTVRRSAGTVSFSRTTGGHETTLFRHVDPSVSLRPFVLMVGKDSYAQLLPGTMTPIVSPSHVLQGSLTRTLFQLLSVTRRQSDDAAKQVFSSLIQGVTEMVSADLESAAWADNQRALAMLGVLPRRSSTHLVVPSGHEQSAFVPGEIIAVLDSLAVVKVNESVLGSDSINNSAPMGLVEQRQLHAVRSSAAALEEKAADDAVAVAGSASGAAAAAAGASDGDIVSMIVNPIAGKLVDVVSSWCVRLQVAATIRDVEIAARDALMLEEANSRESVAAVLRDKKVASIVTRSVNAAMPLLQPPVRPATFTFHTARCSAHVNVPAHYHGALMLAPSTQAHRGPHVAVAREAVDMYGVSSFRMKVMAEWSSLIPPFLPWARFQPGCYIGLCLENYNGTPRFLPQEDPPSVWALSFLDSTKLHLRHSCAFATQLTLIRNGDTIRIVVDRERGTMEAFRTPEIGSQEQQREQSLGIMYDNLPKGVMLFPFVQLMSPRNAAMFLPLRDTLPRATTTCIRAAPLIGNAARSVSGSSDLRCIVCLARFVDNPLTPPAWYHCVQCADIDLCQTCFNAHAHCGHEFAQMRATGFLANEMGITSEDLKSDEEKKQEAAAAAAKSDKTPKKGGGAAAAAATAVASYKPEVNSEVEISPVAAQLRCCNKCVPVDGSFETSVRSLRGQDSLAACWTLLRRPQAQAMFECSLNFDISFSRSKSRILSTVQSLPHGCTLYAGLILSSVADKLTATEIPSYLARVALEPQQRDGIVLASDPSLFVWPEHSVGQASSGGVEGSVLDFSTFLSFFLGQDGMVQVQTNGSQLFQVQRDLWVGEKFSIVVAASSFGLDAPVSVSLYSGMDNVPLVARVMEHVKDVGGLRASIGGKARIVMAGSTAREALVAVKNRGQLNVGDRAVHVDSCIDKATPVLITGLSATEESCTVHDGFKEFRTDMRCLLIPASRASKPVDENQDMFPFPEERARLVRYYAHYAPEKKIEDVEKAIMAYSQSKGGFPEMWATLAKKYGKEIEEKKPMMPQPATRDLLIHSGDLLRVVATLRLFASSGGALARKLPEKWRNALLQNVIGALAVLDRELDITSLSSALACSSGSKDAVHLLSLAVTHAPTMHIATDATLRNRRSAAAPAAVEQSCMGQRQQTDGSSEWWAKNPTTLPLAMESTQAMSALLDGPAALAAPGVQTKWSGSLSVSTGLFTVLNVDFRENTAKLTVSVGAAGSFEIRDVVRSRNIRSLQFLLVQPAEADETTKTVARRLESFTMRYEPSARRLLCPEKSASGERVLMVCVLNVGDDAHMTGHAVLRGGAEADIELRAARSGSSSSPDAGSDGDMQFLSGGALPPLASMGNVEIYDADEDGGFDVDPDDESQLAAALGNSADGRVSRLALTSTLAELTHFVRCISFPEGAEPSKLDARQLYSVLVPTKTSSEAQTLLARSGVARDGDRIADLVGVASKDVFALTMSKAQEQLQFDGGSNNNDNSASSSTLSARVSRAVAAARVVRLAATSAGHEFAAAINNVKSGVFWNALLTSLRALHVAVVSTSATRECVATVRIFALPAFQANKQLAQFLFGPIVHYARQQYEHGSAVGRITGAVRSIIDLVANLTARANENRAVSELVHDGLAKLSAIALPVEQLAFLADAAASAAAKKPWPAIAALSEGSDTVDVATVRRNGDGVAWQMVEPRKTKLEGELSVGNRPGAKEQQSRIEGATLFCGTAISTAEPFDFHYGDRIPAKPLSRYYEAVIPPESVRVAIGWTTKTAAELAKLRRTQMVREIHSPDTVIFDGQAIFHNGSYQRYGWAGTGRGDVCGASIKTSADGKKVILRWSINGEVFPDFELPEKMRNKKLYAFVQISRSDTGMRLGASAELCRFIPLGFRALVSSEQAANDYDCAKRRPADTAASVEDLEKAAKELAEFLAESEKEATAAAASPSSSPTKPGVTTAAAAAAADASSVKPAERKTIKHAHEVLVIQRCLTHCFEAMDIEGNLGKTTANNNNGDNNNNAVSTIGILKRIVTPTYRRTVLAVLQPLVNRESERQTQSLPGCAVRWYMLFSHQKRSEADALHNSVLAQLKRQIALPQFQHTPMFSTSLQMTDNGHTPIDVGGPYFQVWSLLGEELSVDNDQPRTTIPGFDAGTTSSLRFYRNPLFRTVQCADAKGRVLIPQAHRNTPADLDHFRFLGQIFGHLARAKSPLPIDASTVVWKHIVTDTVTMADWNQHVEKSWMGFLEDEELLMSGTSKQDPAAEELLEYFPNFFDELAKIKRTTSTSTSTNTSSSSNAAGEENVAMRRRAAENCVLNSVKPQLDAMRAGVWEILGRRTVCAMTAADLELAVCGDPNPSMEQLLASISCQLDTHEAAVFWNAMKQLTPAEWSDFLFFCAGQRRFPLNKKISVVPMGHDSTEKHLPMASTCFNLLKMPPYKSDVQCLQKLREAIKVNVMELA